MFLKYALFAFILLVPFNTLLFVNILNSFIPVLSYWDEIILIFATILWIANSGKFHSKYKELFFLIFIFFIYILATSFRTLEGDILNFFKVHIFPLLLLMLTLTIKLSNSIKKDLLRIYVYVACFSVFISILMSTLPESFYINLGYKQNFWTDTRLSDSFYISGSDVRRYNGGFSGPIPYSIYLLSALFLQQKYVSLKPYLNFAVFAILFFGLLMTLTRSTLVLFLFVTLLFNWHKFFYSSKVLWYTLGLSLFGFLLFFYTALTSSESFGYFTSEYQFINNIVNFGEERSAVGRLEGYPVAFEKILEAPFFGHGVGEHNSGLIQDFRKIENEYLATLIDIGLVGTILYYGIFIFLYFSSRSNTYERMLILALLLIAMIFPLKYYYNLFLLLFMSIGISISLNNEEKVQ